MSATGVRLTGRSEFWSDFFFKRLLLFLASYKTGGFSMLNSSKLSIEPSASNPMHMNFSADPYYSNILEVMTGGFFFSRWVLLFVGLNFNVLALSIVLKLLSSVIFGISFCPIFGFATFFFWFDEDITSLDAVTAYTANVMNANLPLLELIGSVQNITSNENNVTATLTINAVSKKNLTVFSVSFCPPPFFF